MKRIEVLQGLLEQAQQEGNEAFRAYLEACDDRSGSGEYSTANRYEPLRQVVDALRRAVNLTLGLGEADSPTVDYGFSVRLGRPLLREPQ